MARLIEAGHYSHHFCSFTSFGFSARRVKDGISNHKLSKETIMQPTSIIKKNAFVFILNAFIITLYLFSVSESYAENNFNKIRFD
jgi:hypothetical protein